MSLCGPWSGDRRGDESGDKVLQARYRGFALAGPHWGTSVPDTWATVSQMNIPIAAHYSCTFDVRPSRNGRVRKLVTLGGFGVINRCAVPKAGLYTSALTPSTPAVPNCCCLKGSAPYCSNPPFLTFDIWCSGAQSWAPQHPNVKN